MPHKHKACRRHRIRKTKCGVTNWAEYETNLCLRGSLTFWITPEALIGLARLGRKARAGQSRYPDLAIEITLMLGIVFGQCLRQSEGLLRSVLELTGLDLPVPYHTTLSRRARTWMPIVERRAAPVAPLHVRVDSTGLKVYGAGQ